MHHPRNCPGLCHCQPVVHWASVVTVHWGEDGKSGRWRECACMIVPHARSCCYHTLLAAAQPNCIGWLPAAPACPLRSTAAVARNGERARSTGAKAHWRMFGHSPICHPPRVVVARAPGAQFSLIRPAGGSQPCQTRAQSRPHPPHLQGHSKREPWSWRALGQQACPGRAR